MYNREHFNPKPAPSKTKTRPRASDNARADQHEQTQARRVQASRMSVNGRGVDKTNRQAGANERKRTRVGVDGASRRERTDERRTVSM